MNITEYETVHKANKLSTAAPSMVVSEWMVNTPARQQATIEAFASIWEREAWPEGLLSTTMLASTDGELLLNCARWTSDEAQTEFVRTRRQSLGAQLDQMVPGIQRKPAVNYRLYRSGIRENAAVPGCVVIVTVEFDGPNDSRQQAWVDTVFEAMAADSEPPVGGVSANFYLSTDGTRVLNYAEWTDEKAHQAALDKSGGAIGSGPKWREVRNFTGVKSRGFRRYCSGLSVIPPQRARTTNA